MSVPAHPHGPPMHFEELTQQWKNNPATTIQIALLTRFEVLRIVWARCSSGLGITARQPC